MLIQVQGIRCKLRYVSWCFPGSIEHPWLQRDLVLRLEQVDREIRSKTSRKGRLLIWDALRSFETQRYIFQKQRNHIAKLHPAKTAAEIDAITSEFVRPPLTDKPAPHTTGGAVDVTIWIDDSDQALGEFDDFTPLGRADYFQSTAPRNLAETQMAELRQILRDAMIRAGFVGIDGEWWHYEHGTRWWSEISGLPVKFDEILLPPELSALSLALPRTPIRQPLISRGVAQVFPSSKLRDQSLRGNITGHYYARTRHPNAAQASLLLTSLMDVSDCVFVPSGLNAALLAVWAHTPRHGKILVEQSAYYETRSHLRALAHDLTWTVVEADFSSNKLMALQPGKYNVVLCDHPANWHLTCPDLAMLKNLAHSMGARMIVDTSVQPMQRLVGMGLTDLIVMSLSKYPSMGETIGGAVLGTESMLAPVRALAARLGVTIAPEAAGTLLTHLRTLADRMKVISDKALTIAAYLRTLEFVEDVRLPNLDHVGARPGGQISFRLTIEVAKRAEEIITTHALDEKFPLAFACTFGALYTTFEHFDSRNLEGTLTSPGAEMIEAGRVRLGIGHEPEADIIEALRFVLHAALKP